MAAAAGGEKEVRWLLGRGVREENSAFGSRWRCIARLIVMGVGREREMCALSCVGECVECGAILWSVCGLCVQWCAMDMREEACV